MQSAGTDTLATRAAAAGRGQRVVAVGLFLLRLGMAAVFIGAALPKIAAPDLFALAVHNYQILPAWGVNALALFLPWLELIIGLCLGLGLWSRASALLMAGLMVVFMIALVSAAGRGLSISCGCFEVGEHAAGASTLVWAALRDLGFLVAALPLVRFDAGPSPLQWWRRRRA